MASPAAPVSAMTDYENRWANDSGVKKLALDSGTHSTVSPLLYHPDILSPGLEAVPDQNQHKEVVPQQPERHDPYYSDQTEKISYLKTDSASQYQQPEPRKKRICGLPAARFWLLLALLIILIVALGIGLGVGFGTRHSSNELPSSVHNNYLSTDGAFNGTGLALASYSFGSGGYGVINLYYQHFNGQIRKMQLMSDGSWQGGDLTNIVATDARNGTPISAVAYAEDEKATWHIFYLDQNSVIREKVSDNTTNQWRDGPIGDLNITAMQADAVGLQACWYGSFYGTASYTHSPIPGTGSNTTSQDSVIGMHLWYGKDAQTVSELTWTYNTTKWVPEGDITANGHAGAACYSWGPGSVSYRMLVNLNDEVQVAWKDLNSTMPSTAQHPVDQWVNTTFTIPGVMPNTSLGYTNYFYTQQQDRSISGYNISWAAENTSVISSQNFAIPQKPLPGSHFSVSSLPNASGGYSVVVFNQVNGSDITENSRDITGGQWLYNTLPIPA